ncbi:MAG: hypothetical protein AUK47_21370 [Deltaproteobacteria bacterium CG2_30_63_29]|nr:MAG: hypothetical protein AUK47_21370 [Deltaproteobacteria bacterium CG2_30_63_29]PJB39528.1 MAG: hypothetical protein CO108_17080 [Deltaproteobacteria bacterium CG_4_9_14_3_um_filter_63_12]
MTVKPTSLEPDLDGDGVAVASVETRLSLQPPFRPPPTLVGAMKPRRLRTMLLVLSLLWSHAAAAEPSLLFLRVEGEAPGSDLRPRLESALLTAAPGVLAFADEAELHTAAASCSGEPDPDGPSEQRRCQLQAARRLFVEHVLELSFDETADVQRLVLTAWDPNDNSKLFVALQDITDADPSPALAPLAAQYLCFRGLAEQCAATPKTTRRAEQTGRLTLADIGPPDAPKIVVHLDGVRIGSAPSVLLGLPEGTHELTLSADGFLPYTQSVTLEADRELTVSGILLERRGCARGQRAGCVGDCSEGDASACLRVLEIDGSRFGDEYEPERALAALAQLCAENTEQSCVLEGRLRLQTSGLAALDAAEALFSAACEAGESEGCYHLGLLTYRLRREPKRGEELLKSACDHGVAQSCYDLGKSYEDGWRFLDPIEPAANLRPIEERFEFALGLWGDDRWSGWQEGPLRDANPPQAYAYHVKGCELGLGDACWEVAMLAHLGMGVMHNPEQLALYKAKALRRFEQDCEKGDPKACWSCGEQPDANYREGKGVAFDKAVTEWRRACERGDGDACLWLSMTLNYYAAEPDPKAARALLEQVCADTRYGVTSRGQACASAAEMTENGRGGSLDTSVAHELYVQACTLGDSIGCSESRAGCASCSLQSRRPRTPLGASSWLLGGALVWAFGRRRRGEN